MANYKLYGLTTDRMPPRVADYVGYKFPAMVEVPAGYGGDRGIRGGPAKVEEIFAGAFRELELCARRDACNAHFRALGAGLGLSDILGGWTLSFFAFAPQGAEGQWPESDAGLTLAQVVGTYKATSFAEIGVHITSLRSAEYLAGTILHELAHVAGAPGASAEDASQHAKGRLPAADVRRLHQAEKAVLTCGLRRQYKQNVIGALDRMSRGPGGGRPV
ncbi:hypothetical protein [Roseomonas sp. HF4]|uniref:hypothetical protein n=1 Tax=Roseomonas sp. HF4 TaxID=2562313 RepID=UPI0010BFD027|nr:hypothetical protein [Roseomonas sp. HF4]